MQFHPRDRSDRWKIEIWKIQDSGGRHLQKYKNHLVCGSSNFYEIWPDDTPLTFLIVPTIKNLKFHKPFTWRVRIAGGRFWYAACNSVNRTCSTSTLFLLWNVPMKDKLVAALESRLLVSGLWWWMKKVWLSNLMFQLVFFHCWFGERKDIGLWNNLNQRLKTEREQANPSSCWKKAAKTEVGREQTNGGNILLFIQTGRWARCGYIVYCLCVFCLFVCFFCMVTDFSAENKASGVKILHGGLWPSWVGNLPFWLALLSQMPKIRRIGQRALVVMWCF